MSEDKSQAELNEVALKQLTWKPSVLRTIAVRVTNAVLAEHVVWPDGIDVSDVRTEDVNCIGSAYRQLVKAGVIEMTRDFRRSAAKNARGRIIHAYRLASKSKAVTFLKRNGAQPPSADPQQTFAL
jgi:hypothetical protein